MRSYTIVPCPCEYCIVANTPAVALERETLHGADAARFLRSRAGSTERVGEIADRLRSDLMKGQR